MEFDEYDYLEKAVESREPQKLKEAVDVEEEILESEEKGHGRSSKHRSDRNDDDLNKWSKRSKSGVESRDRDKERGSSWHRSSPKDGERSDRNQPRSNRKHKDGDRDRDRDGDRDRERDRDRNGKDRHKDQVRNKDRDRDRDGDRDRDKDRKERNRGNEKEIDREDRDGERDRDKDRKEHNRGNEKETDREDRDGERDLDKDRKERNRGNEKETDREDRDSERDKDRKERSRGNEKEIDREREQLRRSRSRSERHLEEHDRERSRDRAENKERERETEPKETRRHKEKKEGGAEPEADPERDQRTVFAYQISLKADERDVYDFFSRAGKVRDVRLIMDRNSRRSKGVGYIEFFDSMSVPMAIALSGQPLLGQPVMVKPSEAEKNLVQSTTVAAGASGGIGPYSGGARRLYVGNLHINMKEDQLRQVFEPFGAVELVQVPIDETGNCKGFGFIQFARLDDARAAQSLNGQLEIAGQVIKVSAVTDQPGMQDFGTNAGDFDDDEGGGLTLNARSRALLMQKLDRSGSTSSVAGSLGNPVVNNPGLALPAGPILGAAPPVPPITVPSADIVGVPSECLMLKNMFDPKLETEPDFDLDIKEDVEDECSKFGALRHIYVDKNTAGFVYLRFENTQSAMGAQRSLHGRWFAGKMITATFMLPQSYEAKFPDSR